MPASTLDAFAGHGHVPAAAPVADTYASAAAHFEELGRTGIDFRSRRTTTPWCRSCFDLGVSTDHPKVALGRLTEKARRLKPNGRLFSRSPLSDVLELESMLLGVQGKASCWRTLRVLTEDDDRLYAEHLDALLERAEHQTATLEELLLAAAAHTLGHAAVCAPGSSLTQLTVPPYSPSSPASSGSAAEVAHEQATPRALPGRPPSQQDLRAAGER